MVTYTHLPCPKYTDIKNVHSRSSVDFLEHSIKVRCWLSWMLWAVVEVVATAQTGKDGKVSALYALSVIIIGLVTLHVIMVGHLGQG